MKNLILLIAIMVSLSSMSQNEDRLKEIDFKVELSTEEEINFEKCRVELALSTSLRPIRVSVNQEGVATFKDVKVINDTIYSIFCRCGKKNYSGSWKIKKEDKNIVYVTIPIPD